LAAPPTPFAGVSTPGKVVASAVIVPAQSAQAAFVLPGAVKEILVKEGDQVTAGQALAALDSPALQGALDAAEAALRAAEFDYEYWIPPRFNRPPERRELAKAELVKAQLAFATAQAEFAQTILTAPFDATVVEVRVQAGEYVQPGQVVVTLGGLSQLQIETTDLSERDVHRVKIGQPAAIFVDALDAEYSGKVTAVTPKASTVGGDVVYKVTLALDEQVEGLLWGMSAEVEIATE
ncbi:MAG: efflux RND transporter periplasmic adaptor subunit, partial [Chloroflexota bacterium]